MYINEECLKIVGVTTLEYINWCKLVNKSPAKTETKREFFRLIKIGKIYRDRETKMVMYKGENLDAKTEC